MDNSGTPSLTVMLRPCVHLLVRADYKMLPTGTPLTKFRKFPSGNFYRDRQCCPVVQLVEKQPD